MPILSDPRVVSKLDDLAPEQQQQTPEDFLRAFANTEAKKRKDLKDAFVANPMRPLSEIVVQVEEERAQQLVVAFKASPELVDLIDGHKRAMNDPSATRWHAVKDLVERGLQSLDR